MSSLRKRSGIWYLQWREDGRTLRRSLDVKVSMDPKGMVARQLQARFDRSKMLRGSGLEEERVTIREALDLFLATTTQYSRTYQDDCARRARRWVDFFSEVRVSYVDDIQPTHIQDFVNYRAKTVCGSVIRHDMIVLKAAVKQASQKMEHPISTDSWPKGPRAIAKSPEKIGPYTQDEVNRLVDHFRTKPHGARWDLVISCLAYFGCRWSELEALKIGDIDLKSTPPKVRLENKKTGRSYSTQHRYVEVHPGLVAGLREAIGKRSHGEQIFPGAREPNLRQNMMRACKRLGIRYRKLHGLRHFFITTLLCAGVPIPAVQAMSGHRTLAMVQRYLELPKNNVGYVSGVFQPDPKTDLDFAAKEGKNGDIDELDGHPDG